MAETEATEGAAVEWRVFRAAALVLLAAKLALLFATRPFMDETYYWLWGQHPALSYLDHPPLVGWVAGLAGGFGWSRFALRLPVLVTLAADLGLLWLIARQLAGAAWRQRFWPMAALFLATPILFGLTSVALPDHLLIALTLLTLFAVLRFEAGARAGAPRWRLLYLAGLAIGAATLGKYNGALLGVALLAAFVASPVLRPLLRTPHPWLAALLAVAMQAPVVLWNLQHGYASFDFLFAARRGLRHGGGLSGVGGFVLGAVAVLSPFLVWPLARFATTRAPATLYARLLFWLSTLLFLVASVFTDILIHWNVIAYVAALPFLPPWLGPRWLGRALVGYGGVAIVVAAINYTALPVTAIVGHVDETSAWSYGWDDTAAAIGRLEAEHDVGFIAATDYALAAPLAFALGDRDVTSLSLRREAFDDWFDAAAHAGDDALLVADRWRKLRPGVAAHFAAIDEVARLPVVRFGRKLDTHVIYLGRQYRP